MECELCGRECECRPATIDGVKMMLCPGCMRHGQGVSKSPESSSGLKQPIFDRIRRPKEKDVYTKIEKELVTDWNNQIKKAREKKGLSREELGFKIGERTVTISKIENGDLRPSDKMIEKIEKELEITLFENVEKVPSYATGSHPRGSLTLGDFIKKEDK